MIQIIQMMKIDIRLIISIALLMYTIHVAEYYKMNPNAIIIKARSLEAQLMSHLRYNGGFRDSITDNFDRELIKAI